MLEAKVVGAKCISETVVPTCETTVARSWRPPSEFLLSLVNSYLTFRHRASSILGQTFRYSPENAFIYLINKYISLSDIRLTVHH